MIGVIIVEQQTCSICGKSFSRHAITGELTCFLHGNPDGSSFEKFIFNYARGVKKQVSPANATRLMDYENGDLSLTEILDLFSELIKTGSIWSLNSDYVTIATTLLEDGILDKDGNLTDYGKNFLAGLD